MTSRFAPYPDWRLVAGICGVVAAVSPARAFAQESVELEWESPPECPQRAAVREALRSLVGEDLWHQTTRLNAHGRVERIGERYRLTLSVREGSTSKERRIESDSCADLGGAAAVTLGLLLKRARASAALGTDAGAIASSGNPDSADAPGNTNETAAQRAARETQRSARRESPDDEREDSAADDSGASSARRFHLVLRAPLVSVDLARLPQPSAGFGGGVGFRYAEWRFVAVGRYLLPQTLWAEQFPDVGTRLTRFAVELWSCRGWRSDAFELAPCLTVGVDHLTARAVGPANIVPSSQRFTAALIGGAAALHYYLADWSAVFLGAGIAVATARPSLSVVELGEIGHVGPVQVSVGIGSEWIF